MAGRPGWRPRVAPSLRSAEPLDGSLAVDHGDDDLPLLRAGLRPDEDVIPVADVGPRHAVPLDAQGKDLALPHQVGIEKKLPLDLLDRLARPPAGTRPRTGMRTADRESSPPRIRSGADGGAAPMLPLRSRSSR